MHSLRHSRQAAAQSSHLRVREAKRTSANNSSRHDLVNDISSALPRTVRLASESKACRSAAISPSMQKSAGQGPSRCGGWGKRHCEMQRLRTENSPPPRSGISWLPGIVSATGIACCDERRYASLKLTLASCRPLDPKIIRAGCFTYRPERKASSRHSAPTERGPDRLKTVGFVRPAD